MPYKKVQTNKSKKSTNYSEQGFKLGFKMKIEIHYEHENFWTLNESLNPICMNQPFLLVFSSYEGGLIIGWVIFIVILI